MPEPAFFNGLLAPPFIPMAKAGKGEGSSLKNLPQPLLGQEGSKAARLRIPRSFGFAAQLL